MASSCILCSQSRTKYFTFLLKDEELFAELNTGTENQQEDKQLQRFLNSVRRKKVHVDFGAGVKEKLDFDEANRKYFSRYFRNSDSEVYSCPPVYEYEHPGEPSDIISSAAPDRHPPQLPELYDCLKEKRKGELPEEVVIQKFAALFREKGIGAFIIHGYNWKTKYLKNVIVTDKSMKKSFNRILKTGGLGEGEFDLLVSLSGKFLIVIEVKAISEVQGMTQVLTKACSQCDKTINFLSRVHHDLYKGRSIPVIKVVALPNCERSKIGRVCCEKCSIHTLTRENLSVDALSHWFDNLMSLYTKEVRESGLDLGIHEGLIARLIGPASLMEVRTVAESVQVATRQITGQHGTAESIDARRCQRMDDDPGEVTALQRIWYQLNPDQIAVTYRNPRFLWLTGNPASGKTVLALWKIEQIVKESTDPAHTASHDVEGEPTPTKISDESGGAASVSTSGVVFPTTSSHATGPHSDPQESIPNDNMGTTDTQVGQTRSSVIYLFAGMSSTCLQQVYKDRLEGMQSESCEIVITSMREFHRIEKENLESEPDGTIFYYLQGLPWLIRYLQRKYEGRIIHVIFDESAWLLADLDKDRFEREWNECVVTSSGRLGFVWVVQDTSYSGKEAGLGAPETFYHAHLSRIMRMSRQNVEVANLILDSTFKTGHAVASYIPIVYRVKCVCRAMKDTFHCHSCYEQRMVMLLQHVLEDFIVRTNGTVGLGDIVLISTHVDKVKDLVGHVSPPVPFVKNKRAAPDEDCLSICSVDAYRGCEQALVIIDFHMAACDDLKRLEGITRTLGQLVLLDGGTFAGLYDVYERQIGKLRDAERERIVRMKEIERTPDEIIKLNSIFITHVFNRGKTLMEH